MEKIHCFKIKVQNEEESTFVQEKLFEYGYSWDMHYPQNNSVLKRARMLILRDGELEWTDDPEMFERLDTYFLLNKRTIFNEITIDEFKEIEQSGRLAKIIVIPFLGFKYI